MSKASHIALALSERLATILKAGGYATDAGAKVMRGRKRLDERQLPCIVIIEMEDTIQDQRPNAVKLSQKYVIEGHSACDPDNPNDVGHDLVADIKRALFSEKLVFGAEDTKAVQMKYNGRNIAPREDGLAVVAVSVVVSVEYIETLSEP